MLYYPQSHDLHGASCEEYPICLEVELRATLWSVRIDCTYSGFSFGVGSIVAHTRSSFSLTL